MFSDGLAALGLVCGLLGAAGAACAQSASPDDSVPRSTVDYSQDAQRAATNIFIDRGDIESMPQQIDSLVDAITRLSSFRKPATMPHITRVSRAEIERTICNGPCMVKAWYVPDEGVFFDESLTPETNLIHRSILLHELVHFVQEVNGADIAVRRGVELGRGSLVEARKPSFKRLSGRGERVVIQIS